MDFSTITERDKRSEVIFSVVMVFYLVAIIIAIYYALFALRGAEEQFNIIKFVLYGVLAVTVIFSSVIIKILRMIGKDYIPEWIDVIGFDPEKAPLRNIPYIGRFISNPALQLIASIVLFSVIVLVLSGASQQTTFQFTKVEIFQQQVYPSANLALSIEPASSSETYIIILIESVLVMLNNLLYLKTKNKAVYLVILLLIIPFLGGYGHYVSHNLRYGAEDTAQTQAFVFGLISAYLVILTFSIIPAIVFHQVVNGLTASFTLFSSDTVASVVTLGLITLFIIGTLIFAKAKDVKYTEKYPSAIF